MRITEMTTDLIATYLHMRFVQNLFALFGPLTTTACFYFSGIFVNFFFGDIINPMFGIFLSMNVVDFMTLFGFCISLIMALLWIKG